MAFDHKISDSLDGVRRLYMYARDEHVLADRNGQPITASGRGGRAMAIRSTVFVTARNRLITNSNT